MSIGTKKVLAPGFMEPADSVTFNNPGTFVAPMRLRNLTVTGRGGSGNAGNAGNGGNGGTAGSAGTAGNPGTGNPGGAGGTAPASNLASLITGGTSYPVVVGPGGYITITYETQ